MACQLTITSSDNYNVYASYSSILKTAVSPITGATTITVSSSDSDYADIRYLTAPQSDFQAFNSIAIEIRWSSGNRQEVVVGVKDGIISNIQWKCGSIILSPTLSYQRMWNNGKITVKVMQSSSTKPDYGNLSYLNLYGYYVSTKGYTYIADSKVAKSDSLVGSWSKPGYAYPRETIDGIFSNKKYEKTFSWIAPATKPKYYIMIAYKGYNDGGIGHINIIEGTSTTYIDKSRYGASNTSGWIAWNDENKRLRYTFYAVYDDGVVPSIDNDAKIAKETVNGKRHTTEAKYNAVWVYFNENKNVILRTIDWVKYPSGSYLKDGNDNNISMIAAEGASIGMIPDWESNTYNYNPNTEKFKAWRVKEGSGSWSGEKSNNEIKKIKIGSQNLKIGLILQSKLYDITYYDADTGNKNQVYSVSYNTTITINPRGSLPSNIIANHLGPDNEIHHSTYTHTVVSPFTLRTPTVEPDNYTFIGWKREGNTFTAQWQPKTVIITYNKNGGTGSMDQQTVPYNSTPIIKDNEFTPPQGKRFIKWNTKSDGTGNNYYPGRSKTPLKSSLILYAIWGSYWRKVKAIWIYSPTKINGLNNYKQGQGGYWYPYKPWVNIK